MTTCQQQRPQGAPTGQQLANTLTAGNSFQSICAAKFDGSGDSLHETFITMARGSDTEALTFCMKGLNAIVSKCILDDGGYRGEYFRGDQTYTITNNIFPNNPLISGTPGGPPLSTTPPVTTPPTTTQRPPGQTMTSNCEVCVLSFGSNDPFCTAIPGCTPTSSTPVTPPSPTPSCVIE